ncbi:MAG TPA: hypothetical protein VFY48_00400 [Solirubrobacterales bacterium]|nr:hypothetical protein [Solirubrobacterales bacterium]
MSPIHELLRQAIAERRCVEAVFGGYRRGLCPHVLGTRDGELRVLCFQYAGGGSRGLEPGGDWRCLPLAGLSQVATVDGRWRTKPHSQPQRCIEEVEIEVG